MNDGVVEPTETGWYAYSGGWQVMVFHLREAGQWSVHLDNGSASDCTWSYIEQALGVWDLIPINATGVASAWGRGYEAALTNMSRGYIASGKDWS